MELRISIFLRFSTRRISLSKSELAPSLDTSQDLSLSEASSNLVHKSLTFAGPTRLEVFSLPISAIPPHFHASALGSSNLQSAISIFNEPFELAIDYSLQTDFQINLQTQIRSLHAGILVSQLSSLINVLKAYENTLSSAQLSSSPSTSGNHSRKFSSSINANGTSSASVSGSRFSFSRCSGISRNHRADEEHVLNNPSLVVFPTAGSSQTLRCLHHLLPLSDTFKLKFKRFLSPPPKHLAPAAQVGGSVILNLFVPSFMLFWPRRSFIMLSNLSIYIRLHSQCRN